MKELFVSILSKVSIYAISVKQVSEVFEIRMVLEGFAIRKLSHTIKKHQLQELKNILNNQYEQINNQDINLSLHFDMMFHLKIMEYIDNGTDV